MSQSEKPGFRAKKGREDKERRVDERKAVGRRILER